jgi:hypothetical protein
MDGTNYPSARKAFMAFGVSKAQRREPRKELRRTGKVEITRAGRTHVIKSATHERRLRIQRVGCLGGVVHVWSAGQKRLRAPKEGADKDPSLGGDCGPVVHNFARMK